MADFDPDEFLKKRTPETVGETADTFDPDAFLARRSEISSTPELSATAAINPAVTGAAYAAEAGAVPVGRVIGGAVAPLIKDVAKSYINKPLTAVADVGLMAMGAPPLVGPVAGTMDRIGALKEGMIEASKQASMGAPTMSPVKGVPTTATVRPYFDMLKSVPSEVADKISNIWNTQGGNNAVKAWINSAEGQAIAKANPQFAANAARYIEATPGIMQQAGRMVKPLAVGAARVAGPAGLAYDAYQAAEFARQQDLGGRLAQGQGRAAQQAFRNMNVQYGYQPTAAEAQNILAGGAPRDIQAFGGEDRLRQLIRKQAAEKVLGPIAPGQ